MFGLGSNTIQSFVQCYLWERAVSVAATKAQSGRKTRDNRNTLEVAEGGDGFPGKLAMPKLATDISAKR